MHTVVATQIVVFHLCKSHVSVTRTQPALEAVLSDYDSKADCLRCCQACTENQHVAGMSALLLHLQEGSQPIIQVIDSCKCQATKGDGADPCCTNVLPFNTDYLAFQEMAHPDYGRMNMRFRCESAQPQR